MMKKLLFAAALFALTACGQKDDKDLGKEKNELYAPVAANYAVEEKAEQSISQQAVADQLPKPKVDQVKFPPPVVKPDVEAAAANADIEKKIIKEGDISFETDDVADTRKRLLAALKKLGGYVTDDNEYLSSDDNRKQYILSIRIPAQNFDRFLGDVSETAAKIDSKNISITDITTQYIDVKTRLDNKKALEQRYLSLLQKAGKMSDVLEIEAKLSEIRSDIESTQGQLNYMDKQVSYSSLSITFYTKQAEQVDAGNTFGYKFKHALESGLLLMQGLFFGFISWWPLWVAVIIIVLIIRNRRQRAN